MTTAFRTFIMIFFTVASVSLMNAQTVAPAALPEPYTADEFPDWVRAIRRFEVISVGAFPVLLFYTRVGYDINRWNSNGRDSKYLPWPFKNDYSYKPQTKAEIDTYNSEQLQTVLIAGACSLVFAAADAFIRWLPHAGDK